MSLVLPNIQNSNLKQKHDTEARNIRPSPLNDFKSLNGCIFYENAYFSVFNFLFSLEEHSISYSNEKQLQCAYFCLTTGLNKFYHRSAQMIIPCIKSVDPGRIVKTNSQNSQPTQVLYIADKTDQ